MTGPGQRHEESNVNRAHYTSKTELTTRLFTVLDWSIEDRALHLISQISRAVRRGDVLEIICTTSSCKVIVTERAMKWAFPWTI